MKRTAWLLLSAAFAFAPRAHAVEQTDGMTIEEYLQKLSTVPDVVGRKDPFIQAAPPFDVNKDLSAEGANMSAPVLERYPANQYEVVATLLGDQYPRALVRLPAEEKYKVLIVREKDKMGNRGGFISKILKDGISVQQKVRSPLGFIEKQELVIRVGVSQKQTIAANVEKPVEIRQGMPAPTLNGDYPVINLPGGSAMPPPAMPGSSGGPLKIIPTGNMPRQDGGYPGR